MQSTPQQLIKKYTDNGWWGNNTLHDLVQKAVKQSPNHTALIDPPNREQLDGNVPVSWTFAELDHQADLLGARLYELGLRQGDIVMLQLPNVAEIVVAYLTAARMGLIVSPIAMQYGRHELKQFCDVVAPRGYIASETFQGAEFASAQASALPSDCLCIPYGKANENDASLKTFKSYQASLTLDANDIYTICWTSGTTGRSKGVPRSHNHWMSSTIASEDAIKLNQHAVMLNPFPFVNMASIGGFLYYWLNIQGTLVLHHPFDVHVYLSQLQDNKVEYTIAPPAVLTRLMQISEQIKSNYDLTAVRSIASGSAPLSPTMISGFKDEFGIDIVNIFGSNEGMAILSSAIDVPDPQERAWFFPRFGRTEFDWDNRIAQRIETKLVDPVTGIEVTEPGTPGECLIKGVTVFDGYYQSDDDNRQAFSQDGYFKSGDLFEIAGPDNQYYKFVGRCKSLIVRGGINISPEELDELIASHPSVTEAAVASYPDEVLGERICAYVVLAEGESMQLADLTAYLNERSVAKFKWPEHLEILDALPRNAMNKVVRTELNWKPSD